MKSRLFFGALLGATVCSTNAWAQAWLGNRDLEGPGIRTGNWEMHPGVAAEFGYDSNYFQRADSQVEEENIGPVEDTWRLRVTPSFVIRTVDKRLDEAGAEAGALPLFSLQFSADATGNQRFSQPSSAVTSAGSTVPVAVSSLLPTARRRSDQPRSSSTWLKPCCAR